MDIIKTLIKYTAIGMISAIVVLYFTQNGSIPGKPGTVDIKEISVDDANKLAEANRQAANTTTSYSHAVKATSPAVVNIYTAKVVAQRPRLYDDPLFKHFFGDSGRSIPRKRLETSLGSGVIISEQGHIITNNHVIEGADEIQVALKDGRNVQARLIGSDPESDIAVLYINVRDLPAITLGQSSTIEIGDVVLAIGNPFGVGQTVTMGIVSATGRNQLGLSTFENFIQTDAAINPGNSGGALVNTFGHLIGINTAIYSRSGGSQGIGFAIPIDSVKDIAEQIIQFGHVIRGWIGIEIQSMSPELAESFGLNDTIGVIIAGVLNNGPADQAGLRPGDILRKVNGSDVHNGKQAIRLISRAKPGTEVKLAIQRGGKNIQTTVITSERPQVRKRPR